MAETITSITERLLAEVPEQYDTTEGTYTYDIEKSVAVEFDVCNREHNGHRNIRCSVACR